MKKVIQKFIKPFLSPQFIKFVVSGGSAFALDFAIFYVIFYILNIKTNLEFNLGFTLIIISIANAVSTLISISVTFTLNKFWSFKDKEKKQKISGQMTKFALVIILNYIINNVYFGYLIRFGVPEPLGKIIVIGSQAVWTFFLYKYFVFNPNIKFSIPKKYLISGFVMLIATILLYCGFIYKPFQVGLLNHIFQDSPRIIKYLGLTFIIILPALFIVFNLLYKFKERLGFIKKVIYDRRFIFVMLSLLTLAFVIVIYTKYLNFNTYTYDLGIQFQTIWNTSYGRWFQSGIEANNFLADHFSPLLILPAIIYRIFPHILTLFVIQAVCVAVGAYGIFKLSKLLAWNHLISLILAVSFFLFPSLSGILLYDFHEVVLAIPLLVWGLYFYHKKNNLFIILFVISALAKEDVGIFVGSFGLYILIFKRDIKGLLLALFGYVYSILALLVFIPQFRNEASDTLWRYQYWGATGGEIAKNIITNPLTAILFTLQESKLLYLIRLFLPVAFLPVFAPTALLILLPSLLVNLLVSNSASQVSNLFQYDVMNSVGIFYVAILGIVNLNLIIKNVNINRIIICTLLSLNVLIFFMHPVWDNIKMLEDRSADYNAVMEYKKDIPEDSIVSTTNSIGSYFADREHLQIFYPEYARFEEDPDYILVDKKLFYDALLEMKIQRYIKEKGYEISLETDSLIFLEK